MHTERLRPRVALVTGARFSKDTPGGTLTYVSGLAQYLISKGVGVDLVTNGPAEGVPAGCAVHPVGENFRPSTRQFHKALRRAPLVSVLAGDALIHLQRPDDLWFLPPGHELPPAICTLHGDALRSIRRRHGNIAALYYRRIEAATVSRFAYLVAVDERTAETYSARYPPLRERILVIPNAIDNALSEHSSRLVWETLPSCLTFLYAGRLSVEKRVDQIIQLFRKPGPLSNAVLLVAGSGSEEPRLRQLAVRANVQFLGNVPREDMPALYRRVHALVLASEYEGTPTVALEALSNGCPVVGLPTCGLSLGMSREGVFIADSVQGIPTMLHAAASRRTTGQPIRLSERFTWVGVGQALLNLYTGVCPEAFS